jgi:release factor glutamine methyltransferase
LIAATAIAELARNLEAAGVESPMADARAMTLGVLGLPVEALIRDPELTLSRAQTRRLSNWLVRRIAGTPVSRLIGRREFWSLSFKIGPATLDPRPDSETLVEAVLAALKARRDQPLRLLDLGAGSGCLLLALLSELKRASGVGVDIAPAAVRVAAENAAALGLADRAIFCKGDWARGLSGRFDVIVSNPPYIARDEIEHLPAEVLCDPIRALDGGPDGLDAYRRILAEAPALLAPGGFLALEIGWDQAEAVTGLSEAAGGRVMRLVQDLAGLDRVLTVDFQ